MSNKDEDSTSGNTRKLYSFDPIKSSNFNNVSDHPHQQQPSTSAAAYSSVKRLNLLPKRFGADPSSISDNDYGNQSAFKRFRVNNDDDQLTTNSLRSRLSLKSTTQSARSSSVFGNRMFPQSTAIDSPIANMNDLCLSSSAASNISGGGAGAGGSSSRSKSIATTPRDRRMNDSYFYQGKTQFGGSNLRRNNLQRLSMTPYSPYSRVNIKCIEPTSNRSLNSTNLSNDTKSLNDPTAEVPLSSITQRILERLDRAAIPLSDAKSRISLRIDSSAKQNKLKSKLFDSPIQTLSNSGAATPQQSNRPIQYVLKPSTSADDQESMIENDLAKLERLKQAEKQLQQQQAKPSNTFIEPTAPGLYWIAASSSTISTSSSSSSTTSTTTTLAPLPPSSSLSSSNSGKITARDIRKGRKINDILSDDLNNDSHLKSLENAQLLPSGNSIQLKPFKLTTTSISDNHKDSSKSCDNNGEFTFEFSSPKLVASISSTPNGGVPNLAANATINRYDFSSPIRIHLNNDGIKSSNVSSSMDAPSNADATTKTTANQTSLFELFKSKNNGNQQQQWSCEVCCTKNDDIAAAKCCACEEPNPNCRKKNDPESSTKTPKSTFGFKFGCSSSNNTSSPQMSWSCSKCFTSNNMAESKCISCEQVNPNNGFAPTPVKPSSSTISTNKSNDKPDQQKSLFELFSKKNDRIWSCPTCMIDNDIDVDQCVSCEEVNPNSATKKAAATATNTTAFGFKFGATSVSQSNASNVKKDNAQSQQSPTSNAGWQCYYCKAKNQDSNRNICGECNKIKVIAATKDQVDKYYEGQTFRFGLNRSSAVVVDGGENNDKQNKSSSEAKPIRIPVSIFNSSAPTSSSSLFGNSGGFKFGSSSFATAATTTNTASSSASSPTTTTTTSSSATTITLFSRSKTPFTFTLASTTTTTKTTTSSSSVPRFSKENSTIIIPLSLISSTSKDGAAAKITATTTTASAAATTTTTTASSSTSSLFVFGDTIATAKTSTNGGKAPFSFTAAAASSATTTTSATAATTTTVTTTESSKAATTTTNAAPTTAGLFSFGGGGAGGLKSNDSTTLKFASLPTTVNFENNKDISTSATTTIQPFSFGGTSSFSATAAAPPTTTVSTTSSNATASTNSIPSFSSKPFGKELNFGSPLTVQKLDSGPSIPPMTISFGGGGGGGHQASVANTTTTAATISLPSNSLFTFGSSSNIFANNNTAAAAPPQPQSSSSSLFGASTTIPTSFVFGSNTSATTNNDNNSNNVGVGGGGGASNAFTFTSSNTSSTTNNKFGGFNFGTPTLSFGASASNPNAANTDNANQPPPVMSSMFKFGSSQDQQPPGSNLNFSSFSSTLGNNSNLPPFGSAAAPTLDSTQQQPPLPFGGGTTGVFQFQPSNTFNSSLQQQQQQRMNNSSGANVPIRQIRKAKRRLK